MGNVENTLRLRFPKFLSNEPQHVASAYAKLLKYEKLTTSAAVVAVVALLLLLLLIALQLQQLLPLLLLGQVTPSI